MQKRSAHEAVRQHWYLTQNGEQYHAEAQPTFSHRCGIFAVRLSPANFLEIISRPVSCELARQNGRYSTIAHSCQQDSEIQHCLSSAQI